MNCIFVNTESISYHSLNFIIVDLINDPLQIQSTLFLHTNLSEHTWKYSYPSRRYFKLKNYHLEK